MNIEYEIKFAMEQYIKKSNKIKESKERILKSNLSQNVKDKKINNLHKKLRKIQDKYMYILWGLPRKEK